MLIVGIVWLIPLFGVYFALFPKSPVTQLALFTLVTWAAIAVARPGWPAPAAARAVRIDPVALRYE